MLVSHIRPELHLRNERAQDEELADDKGSGFTMYVTCPPEAFQGLHNCPLVSNSLRHHVKNEWSKLLDPLTKKPPILPEECIPAIPNL